MEESDGIDVKIGSYAPDFSLPAATGGEIRLSSFRQKAMVVVFFVREFH